MPRLTSVRILPGVSELAASIEASAEARRDSTIKRTNGVTLFVDVLGQAKNWSDLERVARVKRSDNALGEGCRSMLPYCTARAVALFPPFHAPLAWEKITGAASQDRHRPVAIERATRQDCGGRTLVTIRVANEGCPPGMGRDNVQEIST